MEKQLAKERPATQPSQGVKRTLEVLVFSAAGRGDCSQMRELLDGGADMNKLVETTDDFGNAIQSTALIEAVSENHQEAVILLFDHRACIFDMVDCAEALVKAGCDMTLQNSDGNTGLQIAQKYRHRAVAAMLLRRIVAEKTEANGKQNVKLTPEVIAAGDCDFGKMRELLDGGASANQMIDTKDENGETNQATALINAVYYNHQEAVNLLLDHKADPNRASSTGCTPLMMAAQQGRPSILETLLERGVIIDAVDTSGGSASVPFIIPASKAISTVPWR